MFTGIIEEIGTIAAIKKSEKFAEIKINAQIILQDIKKGDSIATNGVCLTVVEHTKTDFTAQIMGETLRKTNLKELKIKSTVNLERALKIGDRLGGHIVSGHVDGTGIIVNKKQESEAIWITIEASSNILKYIIDKGSVTIDGISLTVAETNNKTFKISIIPHTQQQSTLTTKNIGSKVNIECDIIGKYIEKITQHNIQGRNITQEYLKEMGY